MSENAVSLEKYQDIYRKYKELKENEDRTNLKYAEACVMQREVGKKIEGLTSEYMAIKGMYEDHMSTCEDLNEILKKVREERNKLEREEEQSWSERDSKSADRLVAGGTLILHQREDDDSLNITISFVTDHVEFLFENDYIDFKVRISENNAKTLVNVLSIAIPKHDY